MENQVLSIQSRIVFKDRKSALTDFTTYLVKQINESRSRSIKLFARKQNILDMRYYGFFKLIGLPYLITVNRICQSELCVLFLNEQVN